MEKLTNINDNYLADIIYNKPDTKKNRSLFSKISTWFALRKHRKEVFEPDYRLLKNKELSFLTLCSVVDMITILETVYFYNNSVTNKESDLVLLGETSYAKHEEKKILIILDHKNDSKIVLQMYRSEEDGEYLDHIDIKVDRNTGKKISTEFFIINSYIKIDDPHSQALLHSINCMLCDLSSRLFKRYYDL